jgi:cytoskeleton protein RodZ
MTQEERFINGELLRLRREERGWVLSDMALRACMSVKQIRQLEEGGTSAFYSEAVKLTAAKKAAAVLGLTEQELFAHETAPAEHQEDEPEAFVPEVQPTAEPVSIAETATQVDVATPEPVFTHVPEVSEAKPKTSLWTITGLFVVALGVAAYLQPQEEESAEAAPPLQAVPEADAAASSAESVASAASAPVDVAASAVQKSMPAPLTSASGPVPSVAPVRVPASAALAAPVAASAASRAP